MMPTVNLDTGEGVKIITFPDKQPSVRLDLTRITQGDPVQVVASLTSPEKLLQLLAVTSALRQMQCVGKRLVIPYLMGARSDRFMEPGASFDLQWVAHLINSCHFVKVVLFDVHSDVATALIARSYNYDNEMLVGSYAMDDAVLIVPDAGAVKKVAKYLEWNPHIKDVVYCIKERELSTGKLKLRVLEPEKCGNRNCVIIDDICDGGATFIAIAEQIKPADLTLVVTHGIFSKGFEVLAKHFNRIITSDSIFVDKGDWPGLVTTIPHGLAL